MATINVTRLILGQRQMIEKWMQQNKVDIAAIQETKIQTNSKKKGKNIIGILAGSQRKRRKPEKKLKRTTNKEERGREKESKKKDTKQE